MNQETGKGRMSHEESDFCIDDFKNWMSSNSLSSRFDFNAKHLLKKGIGIEVESKVNLRKLVSKIDPEGGDALVLAKEFREYGGRVLDVDGSLYLVEVDSGSFTIPRAYCTRKV